MRIWNINFEYTEQAKIPNIIADTAEQAIEGAKKLAERGRVKDPDNFTAEEVIEEDYETNSGVNTVN